MVLIVAENFVSRKNIPANMKTGYTIVSVLEIAFFSNFRSKFISVSGDKSPQWPGLPLLPPAILYTCIFSTEIGEKKKSRQYFTKRTKRPDFRSVFNSPFTNISINLKIFI